MNKSFNLLITFYVFFSNEFIEANRRGGWSGGGGGANHGNNRWKQGGGGGFNSWRQQQFKHNNNNQYFIVRNDDNNGNNFNTNYFNNNNNQHDSYNRNPDVPVVNFGQQQVTQTRCAIPTMGDSSKFELRCIFPTSEQDDDCSSVGSHLPSGTSVLLRCKPPYTSETKDMRIWVCEEGTWKGEFKSFTCVHPPTIYHSNSGNNAGNNFFGSNNQNHNNNQRPNTNSWQRPQLVDQETQTQTERLNSNNWKQGGSSKPLIPSLIPGLLDSIIGTEPEIPETVLETEDDAVRPPWFSNIEKWRPSSTTTSSTTTIPTTTRTTTTTTTTRKPYLPPAKEEPKPNDWSSFFSQTKGEGNNSLKCPSLSRGTGIQLECLSKTPVPWDPSSFIVSQSNCTEPQQIGTEATYKCDQYYEGVGLTIQYRKCKEGGQWTGGGNIFSCALECGKSNPVGRIPLITNGEPTYKAQWPWHAALFYRDIRKEKHDYNCGGTLIHKKVVLTAGHCVTEPYSKAIKTVNQFRIDLGRYERTVDDEFVQSIQAESVVLHPSYNPVSYDSDLAIIILKQEASIGFHVRPICYPQTQNSAFEEIQLAAGSSGTVVGFGKNENGDLSDMLHMARLKVVSQQECSENFADTNFGAALTKSTTFCAGLKNGTNVCSGDSGGGIYFPVSSGGVSRWYLQGLVSVGITAQDGSNRCDPTRFSVFTKLSSYSEWIVRVLSENDAL